MSESPPPERRLAYSPREVAELIACSESMVRKMLRDGTIFSRREGTRWFVPHAAIEAWLEGRPWPPTQNGPRLERQGPLEA